MKKSWVVTYTTAPEDYDWFGTHTVTIAGKDKRGKTVRMVMSDPKHVDAQRGRYASGLHMVADQAEWDKLVSYNLVIKENPMVGAVPDVLLWAGTLASIAALWIAWDTRKKVKTSA